MRIILSGLCTFVLITSSVIIKNECGKDIINYNIKDIEIRQINTSLIGLSDKCIEKDPKIESFSKEFGLKLIVTREQYCLIRVPDRPIMNSYIKYFENRKYLWQ